MPRFIPTLGKQRIEIGTYVGSAEEPRFARLPPANPDFLSLFGSSDRLAMQAI
jgi:hypothetical protein